MMIMARLQTISNVQKKLQGSGSSRYIKASPDNKPLNKLWVTPPELKKQARAFYQRIGAALVRGKVLCELDLYSFITLCQVYQQLHDMQTQLDEDGYTVKEINSQGVVINEKRHPALIGHKEALTAFINMAQRFGLTPFDRKRIDLPVDENPNDKTREFFGL
jgi:P27 family predicted phage terminase small subunit